MTGWTMCYTAVLIVIVLPTVIVVGVIGSPVTVSPSVCGTAVRHGRGVLSDRVECLLCSLTVCRSVRAGSGEGVSDRVECCCLRSDCVSFCPGRFRGGRV